MGLVFVNIPRSGFAARPLQAEPAHEPLDAAAGDPDPLPVKLSPDLVSAIDAIVGGVGALGRTQIGVGEFTLRARVVVNFGAAGVSDPCFPYLPPQTMVRVGPRR